jgi:recombination protein RecA
MARKKVIDKKTDNYEGEQSLSKNELSSIHRDIIGVLKKSAGDVSYILGEDDVGDVKEWLSTGSTVLDSIISNNPDADGGIPVGKLVEISGEAASGKSMLSYLILKDCLDKGGIGVVLDTEYSLNIEFLKLLGIDVKENNFIYHNPHSIEEVFDTIESIIKSLRQRKENPLCCIIWDSVAATSSDVELEEDNGKNQIGIHARAISKGLRKVMPYIGNQRISLIFLNQLRVKVGITFGDPHVTPGGKAIPFASSVRLRLFSDGKLKAGNDVMGVGIKPHVQKNRFGPPDRKCHLKMYFSKGLIDEESWFDVLQEYEIVEKSSAQKSQYIDKDTGEVHEFLNRNFVSYLRERPELRKKLQKEVKRVLYREQDPMKREEDIVQDFNSGEVE